MDFYKKTLLLAMLLSAPVIAKAETGYYLLGQYRYFGPKLDVDFAYDGIDAEDTSAKRFYPSIYKNGISYVKNIARAYNDAMSYGDWDKERRVIMAYEYDSMHSKTSKGSYGYNADSSSVLYLTDWGFANNYWRLGVGGSATYFDTSYDNGMSSEQQNFMSTFYAIYNDAPNQFRVRSRFFAGYGQTDIDRMTSDGAEVVNLNDKTDSYFYGFENTITKTYGSDVYIQPALKFNGYGVKQGSINDGEINAKSKSLFLLDSLVGLYVGFKGNDFLGNKYNFKFGPDVTYVFSSPYDAYYLDDVYIKSGHGRKDYWAWKAYLNYNLPNGVGVYSDFRYYQKDDDNIAFALGLNYKF